ALTLSDLCGSSKTSKPPKGYNIQVPEQNMILS
ncbi:hypothetical protein SOVF_151680, partial [Spinacia oleracea]